MLWRHVFPYLYINSPQLTGEYLVTLTSIWIFDPQHFIGKTFAELLMQPTRIGGRRWPDGWVPTFVNQPLNVNVRYCFPLEISFLRFIREIVRQCSFNITRMGVVALDKVRVVAVHRPYKITNGLLEERMSTLCETARAFYKFECAVFKRDQCRFFWQHRFHHSYIHEGFMPVSVPVVYPKKLGLCYFDFCAGSHAGSHAGELNPGLTAVRRLLAQSNAAVRWMDGHVHAVTFLNAVPLSVIKHQNKRSKI